MSNRNKIEELTENFLKSIIQTHKLELVDIEYVKEVGNYYLRIYIDKEGGVTINDCEIVSRELEVILDEKDPIVGEYILEVSSPGLDRPLKKENDFRRSIGKDVEVKLYKAIDGEKEFIGTLVAYTQERITLKIEEKELVLDRKTISRIRLAIKF